MLLQRLTKNQILTELKNYFTDEELDSLQPEKLDELMEDCDTLEYIVDNHFATDDQ